MTTEEIWRQVLYWSEEEMVGERCVTTRQVVGARNGDGGGEGRELGEKRVKVC
jgi:hypothetical protein